MTSLPSAASVREHLVEELHDLRHAEDLLIERKKASRQELKAAFRNQLASSPQGATEGHGPPGMLPKSGGGQPPHRHRD
jgi:hypothetical protein